MKSLKKAFLLASFAGGLVVSTGAQPSDQPASDSQNAPRSEQTNSPAPAPNQPAAEPAPMPTPVPPPEAVEPSVPPGADPMIIPAPQDAPVPDQAGGDSATDSKTPNALPGQAGPGGVPGSRNPGGARGPGASSPTTSASGSLVPLTPPSSTAAFGDKGLRMNFRNVPLDMVLNYMSDAAGFIILLETEVKGTVDVWSNQPLSKSEAVTLLNTVLNKNGYAAMQDGRTLTILSRDEARRRDIPIKTGNVPANIPKNAEIVTQIIPVRSLNATQLTKDLAPLLPTDTTLTANEAGNSLIMTDTQINIRKMAEIIKALDTVSSSVNSIRVFPIRFADAKAMVTVVKELFPSQNSTSGNQGGQGGFGRFNPMAMFGGGRGGPGGGGNSGDSSSQKPSTRVSVISDDTSNTLIVSAPEDVLPIIEDLVKSLDVSVEDETELRVYRLQFADPSEMADLLTSLFPDDTTSNNNNNRGQGPFGFFGGGRQGGNNSSSTQSDRMKRKGRVLAVPDQRTASVVVSADKSLMPQIAQMVENLDANPAKKQKVFVYSLQNADVQDVQGILNDLFQSNNSRNSRNASSQTANPMTTRSQQQQQSGTTTTFGNNSNGGRGQ